MQTRKAGLADLEALLPHFVSYLRFYKREASLADARSFLAENIRLERSVIFLAFNQQEQIVGFSQIYLRLNSLSLTHYVYISDLFVAPECRKQGIARGLMRSVERFARESNINSIQLETAHSNTSARALYESLNFEQDLDYRTYSLTLPSPVLGIK